MPPFSEQFGRSLVAMSKLMRQYVWLLVALLIATVFVVVRIKASSVYIGADLSALIRGEGHIPYQYRVLIPFLVGELEALHLVPLIETILSPLNIPELSAALNSTPYTAAPFVFLEILSVWGLIVAFYRLLTQFPGGAIRRALGVSLLLALLVLVPRLTPDARLWYPSDMPAILVVVLGYLLLFNGKVQLFYPLFILGTLNRETTLFMLPLLTFLPTGVLRSRRGFTHACVLFGVWAAIKLALFFLFRGNHGYPMHPNIIVNMELLQDPRVVVVTLTTIVFVAIVAVAAAWRSQDPRLRAACQAAALFIVAIFLAGKMDELRIYLELAPLFTIALLSRRLTFST